MQQDDMQVIQLVLQGRQSAYALLVDKYNSFVFTLVMRYVTDRGIAEELAQDVFVKAYRSLADFKGNSKFSTWLYTIVNTTCLSHIRKRKDMTILLEQEQMLSVLDHLQHDDDPGHRVAQRSEKQVITNAIAHLSADDARVITLFYLAEQSLEETALILGITAANAKVKLYRARLKLREVLETKFIDELT